MIRCVEISLAIPDNEARTALATLQRLGVALTALERADLYRCDVAPGGAESLVETLRTIETIFNPNKHLLRARDALGPEAGEVWIDEREAEPRGTAASPGAGDLRVAGRTIVGLRGFERFTAWRLATAPVRPADAATVATATDLLLCNPAFEKATRL
ncbi:MAG: hypothetical protein NVS2B3_19380 [Vulcanimicrobiaceae bacterium]